MTIPLYTPVELLKIGDLVELTGTGWDEISKISPVAFKQLPEAGQVHEIVGTSPMGPYFLLEGNPWPVGTFFTAVLVGRGKK